MLGKVHTLISGEVKTCFLLALWRDVEFGLDVSQFVRKHMIRVSI